ncbi:MAG: hypothetical protein JJE02_08100, partial [Propionibacteriales bacterium]|nr:hypothetical protein [Propionibacteriales bacterium]
MSVSTRASPQLAVAGIAACLMVAVSAVAGHRTESEAPRIQHASLATPVDQHIPGTTPA